MTLKKVNTNIYEFSYIDIKYKNVAISPNIELFRWKKIKALKYKIQNIFMRYRVTPIKGNLSNNVENVLARILFESFSRDKITELDDGLFNIVNNSKSLYNDLKTTFTIASQPINDATCEQIISEINIDNTVEKILDEISRIQPAVCPDITIIKDDNFTIKIYESTTITIPMEVYEKLKSRYDKYFGSVAGNTKKLKKTSAKKTSAKKTSAKTSGAFLAPSCEDAIICLLLRYNSLGSDGNQMGIPEAIKDLFKECDIDFEGFASSLNHYYYYYCSMFYDIEKYFGSLGPFQNITYVRGTFMLNPPYEKNLLNAMTAKIIGSLEKSRKKLCFIFGSPTWANYKEITFHKTLCDSKFFKTKYVFGDYEVPWYDFLTKTYARIPSSTRYILANYDMDIKCLQSAIESWRKYNSV